MTALATSSGGSRATAASGIDHAIRLSAAAAVLAVAGIAAYVSYWHAYAVVRAYGGWQQGGIIGPAHPHSCRPPSLVRGPGPGWRGRAPPKRVTAWVLPGYAAVIRTS